MAAQDDFDVLSKFAKEFLDLDDETAERFVNSSMKRRGHTQSTSWIDSEGDSNKSGSDDFFSGNSRSRSSNQRKRASGSGSGWQYD